MARKGNDLSNIIPNIKEAIRSALQEDVSAYVKQKLSENAKEVVYGAYNPNSYSRRYSLENVGLMDDYMSGEMSLTVKPIASFNSAYRTNNSGNELATLVEYGNGGGGYTYDYIGNGDNSYLHPRPYISTTATELESDGQLVNIIQSSILERL